MGCSNAKSILPVVSQKAEQKKNERENPVLVQQSLTVYFISSTRSYKNASADPANSQLGPLQIKELIQDHPNDEVKNLKTTKDLLGEKKGVSLKRNESVREPPLSKNVIKDAKLSKLEEALERQSGHESGPAFTGSHKDIQSKTELNGFAQSLFNRSVIDRSFSLIESPKAKDNQKGGKNPYSSACFKNYLVSKDAQEIDDNEMEEEEIETIKDQSQTSKFNDQGGKSKDIKVHEKGGLIGVDEEVELIGEEEEGEEEVEVEEDSYDYHTISKASNEDKKEVDKFKERQSYNPRLQRDCGPERETDRISYRSKGEKDTRLNYKKMATNVVNATAQAELHQTTVMNQTRDQNMSLVSYFKVRGADNSLCFDDINQYSQFQEKFKAKFSLGNRTPANILEKIQKNEGKRDSPMPRNYFRASSSVRSYKLSVKRPQGNIGSSVEITNAIVKNQETNKPNEDTRIITKQIMRKSDDENKSKNSDVTVKREGSVAMIKKTPGLSPVSSIEKAKVITAKYPKKQTRVIEEERDDASSSSSGISKRAPFSFHSMKRTRFRAKGDSKGGDLTFQVSNPVNKTPTLPNDLTKLNAIGSLPKNSENLKGDSFIRKNIPNVSNASVLGMNA